MLTPLQEQKLTRYFRVYDVDDDGRVARPDFERVLENVRALYGAPERSPTHTALVRDYLRFWEGLRASADADHDEGVDLAEWLLYWDAVIADEERYRTEVATLMDKLLEIFDTDGDGVLGSDEFCNFYGVHGLKSALARQVFLDLDADGDGRVTREELMTMAHEFYRGDDPTAPGNRLFGPGD